MQSHEYINLKKQLIINIKTEEKIKENELLKDNQKNDELQRRKGNLLIKLGKYDEYWEYIDQAIAVNPKNQLLILHKGIALAQLKKYEQAFECFNEAKKIDPTNQEFLIQLAQSLEDFDEFDGAYKFYNEAQKLGDNVEMLNINKGNFQQDLILASALINLKRCEEAIELCDKELSNATCHKRAYATKARALYVSLRYEEALEICDRLIQMDENFQLAYDIKGKSSKVLYLFQEGPQPHYSDLKKQSNNVQKLFDQIRRNIYLMLPQFTSAGALVQLKRYEEAIEFADISLKLNPRGDIALGNKGMALTNLDRLEEAVECFGQALSITKDHPILNYLMGSTLINLDREEESIEYLDRAIKSNPKNSENHLKKAQLLQEQHYLAQGDMKSQLRFLTYQLLQIQIIFMHFFTKESLYLIQVDLKVQFQLQVKPLNSIKQNLEYGIQWVYYNLTNKQGRSLLNLHLFDQSIIYLLKAHELNPQDEVVIFNIGLSLERLNKNDAAIFWINKGLKISPDTHYALDLMGLYFNLIIIAKTLIKIGKFKEAILFSQKAVSLDPSNEEYQQNYLKGLYMLELEYASMEHQ
ncbi:unnamed protein product (macronuclear) [Paramecium tetraurelia]|uniref:Tetratricopeptide repeat protein n=1 Tax=Paramecium tetraurelia TaxID=5888 RepID=A0BW31_PARTE|nr:uncharacterized protein GSPATT00032600001 [Paramecium tetraurelia]CAK62748.1 unnamed protein product [Paramecium tetraurelia]|eukprot:XP_001430146.1 hypothetical protein (macronuclear) [Paramecium tetraurelia strain d4-2]